LATLGFFKTAKVRDGFDLGLKPQWDCESWPRSIITKDVGYWDKPCHGTIGRNLQKKKTFLGAAYSQRNPNGKPPT